MTQPDFSIIVPCYNEEGAIRETVEVITRTVDGDADYELIIVNDGSSDRSGEILNELKNEFARLVVVNHTVNSGYGASLKTGVRHSHSDLIVITDADGTYPNERIPEFVEKCREADMVIGARIGDDVTYPLRRKLPKAFLKAYASWMVGQPIPDMNSGLRVFRKEVAERFIHILPDGFSFTTTITMAMMRNHYRVIFEPISYAHRIGDSKIQPIRDTARFVQLILRTGLYFGPLRFFGPLILALLVAALVSGSYDLFVSQNLTDKTVILIMFTLNTTMFALLADMIDKRIV